MPNDHSSDFISPFLNSADVMNLMRQPIHIVSADGILRFVNKAWSDTYHLSFEDAIGTHIADVTEVIDSINFYLSLKELPQEIAADMPDLTYDYLEVPSKEPAALQVIKQRKQISVLTQTPDHRQVVVRATPIFNGQGEIILVFTTIQDLTMMANWKDRLEVEVQKNKRMQEEVLYLRENQSDSKLIGSSPSMVSLRKLIAVVAKSDASILISGESGVGKEVVAKEIYRQSTRNGGPFITVNCAAIPETLLESELFGHEKGAFTGAVHSKIGLFELANGGTIMLDEIGEFPIRLQPKLLRVLQEQEFRRVGGTNNISIDVRVIAATNCNLLSLVQSGQFRLDLYYRLNVIPIEVPPLRDRNGDSALLASAFLVQFNKKYQASKFFQEQSILLLEQYDWPGNVRELENVVERLVIIGEQNAITPQQVMAVFGSNFIAGADEGVQTTTTLKDAVSSFERHLICDALRTYGSTYKAAKVLGTSQPTIVRKAKALGITDW